MQNSSFASFAIKSIRPISLSYNGPRSRMSDNLDLSVEYYQMYKYLYIKRHVLLLGHMIHC